MSDFLLIHGSCHGAWCWDDLIPHLTTLGHTATAIDLPSHGQDTTPAGDVTLALYARAIVAAIKTPVILVGHSMAGYPITAAAGLAPEKISALVYLCAYVPMAGKSLAEMRRMAPSQPLLDAIIVDEARVTFRVDPAKAAEKFYHDVPPARAAWAIGQLGPQPILPQETPLVPMHSLPRHYLRCTDDRTIPPAFQTTMTADWPAGTVSDLPTSHSPFLSDPALLAQHLDRIARAIWMVLANRAEPPDAGQMDKRLPVTFILISVMLDAMGIGLILPVMPALIQEIEGTGLGQAAVWGGVLATVFAAMQFLFGPTLGSLSDRYGRRPVLIISLVIMALIYVLMALAQMIWLLLVGRIIGGITAATQATSAAYMADISRPEEKAANFGLIGAAFGMGFIFGPLIGGVLAEYGTRAPFWAAAVLAAANAVFGYYVLPETVTDRIRRPFDWRRANPLGALRNIGALPGLKRLLLISFVYTIAFFVYPGVWAYFGAERFGWGPGMIGLSLAVFGVGIAVVQGLLIRPIIARIGERRAVILGLGVDVAAFIALGFVTQGWIALALTPLTALGSIAGPALQGIMSRTAADNQQGELQGTISSINAVATIVAPLLVTQTFWFFTAPDAPVYLPGAPFLLSALLTIGCIAVFIQTPRPKRARGT